MPHKNNAHKGLDYISRHYPPRNHPRIELFIRMPSGLVPLDENTGALTLPQNPALPGPAVAYGPYLRAVAGYFSANSNRRLKDLLSKAAPSAPPLRSADTAALVGEKHGALYSVSKLEVRFPSATFAFAVNTAFLPEQKAFLAVEYRLLRNLHRRFHSTGLPLAHLSGRTPMKTGYGDSTLDLFAAEWIDNHNEFHFSSGISGVARTPLRVNVWKPGESALFLDERRTIELFEGAAAILTACLDTGTFRQIYPWHHGAGDFIVDESASPVSVRLITARDYRPLLPPGSDTGYKLLGSLHFLVNLSIRMRIDRLDGTGPLVWAGPEVLEGVIRGFSRVWEEKERDDPELPGALDMFSFFLGLTYDERLGFSEVAAENGRVEAGEEGFIDLHLPDHVRELSAAVERGIDTF